MQSSPVKTLIVATAIAAAPLAAFAVGSSDDTPPAPTETTTTCADGLIWDIATETCMSPADSTNDDNALMDAVRELAYAGRYADATSVLDRLDATDTRVLTYYGFTARKKGDVEGAMAYYQAALAADPNNNLARSYMGQGMVEIGDFVGARAQLSEIRARDGRQTWPEIALRMAIDSGTGPSY